jgi:hypothetical protein
MKKITIGFIIGLISTFSWGIDVSVGDSISNSIGKLSDYGPTISNTQTQEDEFESSEQSGSSRYSCELINDGSFENGSEWIEDGNYDIASRLVDPSNYFYCSGTSVYAYSSGTTSWWGGGYTGALDDIPVSNYVQQEIDIPSGATEIRFQMISYRPDENDASEEDFFFVIISGETVFTHDMIKDNDSCPDWEEQIVDISDYAGQTVTLRFEVQSGDSDYTGNVLVDYIRVCNPLGRGLPAIFLLLLGD